MRVYSAILWIDQDEAFVFHFKNEKNEEAVVMWGCERHAAHHPRKMDKAFNSDASSYFESIEASLADASDIVIGGPEFLRYEFATHLGEHEKGLSQRIVAIEKIELANDTSIFSLAQKYFNTPNEMLQSSYIAGL